MADKEALPEGEAPKKSKLKKFLIIFLILLIILAAGGGGAYWWFFMRAPVAAEATTTEEGATSTEQTASEGGASAPSEAAKEGEEEARIERQSDLPRSQGMVLPLPPFVVNLSDPTGKRYLRLGMEVEVNRDVSAVIKSQAAKIRDAVIILLAGKTYADISSAEGKILLKAEVAARLNQILGGTYVVRVYFTDFIVGEGANPAG